MSGGSQVQQGGAPNTNVPQLAYSKPDAIAGVPGQPSAKGPSPGQTYPWQDGLANIADQFRSFVTERRGEPAPATTQGIAQPTVKAEPPVAMPGATPAAPMQQAGGLNAMQQAVQPNVGMRANLEAMKAAGGVTPTVTQNWDAGRPQLGNTYEDYRNNWNTYQQGLQPGQRTLLGHTAGGVMLTPQQWLEQRGMQENASAYGDPWDLLWARRAQLAAGQPTLGTILPPGSSPAPMNPVR